MSLNELETYNVFKNQYNIIDSNIIYTKRKDGNISLKIGSVFAYIDFINGSIIARIKLSPSNIKLVKYKGIWKNYTGSHDLWKGKAIEIPFQDESEINTYIEIFELAKQENMK